jgi:hypothetical protein
MATKEESPYYQEDRQMLHLDAMIAATASPQHQQQFLMASNSQNSCVPSAWPLDQPVTYAPYEETHQQRLPRRISSFVGQPEKQHRHEEQVKTEDLFDHYDLTGVGMASIPPSCPYHSQPQQYQVIIGVLVLTLDFSI